MKRWFLPISAVMAILTVIGVLVHRPATTAQEISGGMFRSYLTSEPANLDPARGVDVSEGLVQAKIFDGLVRYDENMKLVGDLAESWEIIEEGRSYVFHLRPGVLFHDGTPLTAADIVFSLTRLLDPAVRSPRAWILEKVAGARDRLDGKVETVSGIAAIDEKTVKITLAEPFAPFLSMLSMPAAYILPVAHQAAIADRSFFDKPAGTGPFKLIGRERDSYLRLSANPDYFGDKPGVGTLEMRVIPESMKAEMEFETGNLDILQLHPSNYERFKARGEEAGKVTDIPAMNIFYVGFNNQAAPFNDIRVRKALNYLVDREALIKAVFKGRGVPARGSIPPGILGYSDQVNGYGYDPAEGRRLLKEAGYDAKKPLKFSLYQKSSQAAFEITRLLQGELKKHGIEVSLKPMEWSALKDAIDKGEAEAFYLSWYGDYPDGENFLYPLFHSKNWGSGGNRARFKDENVDTMLEKALKIQDQAKRAEAYDQ
ncbi:MAG TPA: ABC transporter substrate-binding protein, partial [Candidatus Ozemobacteraceae bacterium]|nr:ABC transporter substrate-binding protein [Candidatus Ozemobacteraceae bacterium]